MPPLEFEDELTLRAVFRDEIERYTTDSGIAKGVDWKGWIMVALGVVGVVAAFTMFVFKTNAAADLEHAEIKARHGSDMRLHDEQIQGHSESQRKVLDKLDTLTTNQVRIGERLRVRGLKRTDNDDGSD